MIARFCSFVIKALRIVWSIIVFGSKTLFLSQDNRNKKFYIYAKKWGQKLLKITNVKLDIRGLENINSHQNYIFIANHSNLFDIPILQATLPNDFRIIYKKELERVPFFGLVLKKSPYIALRRTASKSTMASIDEAINQMHQGASVLVFPEGTRSIDGTLGDFKRGAFLLAYRGGKPIVPITIIGSNLIFPRGKLEFNSVKIRVIINEPIEVSDLQNKTEEIKLMNKIHFIINENLKFRGMNVS